MAVGYQNKVAIVTGGASGIGRGLCEALARAGARVVVADLSQEGAGKVAAGIEANGGKATAAVANICKEEEIRALVDNTGAQFGRLDYMFNNAGIGIAGEARDIALECWERLIDTNLRGTLYGTLAAYAVMVRQGSGHIVNTASLAGLVGLPTSAPYAMTKHGVIGLSTSLRLEARDLGVRVSVVCPGYVQTAFYDTATVVKAERREVFSILPRRMATPDQAAQAILRGVARNRSLIVFPWDARLLWYVHRLCPRLLDIMGRSIVRNFRASRGA